MLLMVREGVNPSTDLPVEMVVGQTTAVCKRIWERDYGPIEANQMFSFYTVTNDPLVVTSFTNLGILQTQREERLPQL